MKKIFSLAVFAALMTLGLNAQNCQPSIVVQSGNDCNYKMVIATNNCPGGVGTITFGEFNYPITDDSLVITNLPPGTYNATWKFVLPNGSTNTGSQSVYWPGNGNPKYTVICPQDPLVYPISVSCKNGIRVFRPTVYTPCSELSEIRVTITQGPTMVPQKIFTGQSFINSGALDPGIYKVTIRTTIQTNDSPSDPFDVKDCVYTVVVPGNTLAIDCSESVNIYVENCELKANFDMPTESYGCNFVSIATVIVTGNNGSYWQGTPGEPSSNMYLTPNVFYTAQFQITDKYGVTTTCWTTFTAPPSPLEVDCSTGALWFTPGSTNCSPGMCFKLPSQTCEAFEWQAVKVISTIGTIIWQQMAMSAGQTLCWDGTYNGSPAPSGWYTVMFVTSVYPTDPSTGESYKKVCSYEIFLPPVNICCDDLTPPTVTCPTNLVFTVNCDGTKTFKLPGILAVDNCAGPNQLSYHTNITKFGVPTPLFDGVGNGLQQVTWGIGLYNITIKVTDTNGNTSICTYSVTISSVNESFSINCGPVAITLANECAYQINIPLPIKIGGCGAVYTSVTAQVTNSTGAVVWQGSFNQLNGTQALTTGPLPGDIYTVHMIATNANGQTATCTTGNIFVPQIDPFLTIDCGQVQLKCNGSGLILPPVVTSHCGGQAFISCWQFQILGLDSLYQQCLDGNNSYELPFGVITNPSFYEIVFEVTLLDGRTIECSVLVNATGIDLCCLDAEPPVAYGCVCLPDTLVTCENVDLNYDLSHIGFSDNCGFVTVSATLEKIGFIAPVATSQAGFLSASLDEGTYIFTFTGTDENGNSTTITDTLVIDCPGGNSFGEVSDQLSLTIAPNPAQSWTKVALGGDIQAELSISTTSGSRVYSRTIQGSNDVDVSMLPTGTYLVNVRNEKGSKTRLLIVTK